MKKIQVWDDAGYIELTKPNAELLYRHDYVDLCNLKFPFVVVDKITLEDCVDFLKKERCKLGNYIAFRLDGNWLGKGNVVSKPERNIQDHSNVSQEECYRVCLTEPCKEYETGTVIFVSPDEVDLNEF